MNFVGSFSIDRVGIQLLIYILTNFEPILYFKKGGACSLKFGPIGAGSLG